MKKRQTVLWLLTCSLLFALGMMARDISAERHPNLAAAQQLCHQAIQKIETAQKVNELKLNGHAERAKELLGQVDNELNMAADTANRDRH